jgi:hypothetical protein
MARACQDTSGFHRRIRVAFPSTKLLARTVRRLQSVNPSHTCKVPKTRKPNSRVTISTTQFLDLSCNLSLGVGDLDA